MNKTNIQLRTVLIRLHKLGKTAEEIVEATGIKIRTVYNYLKILTEEGEDKVLIEPAKNTRKPIQGLITLKQYIKENPFAFNKEIAEVLGSSKSSIQRWRQKLGVNRKKAKTTYKEASVELKKSF